MSDLLRESENTSKLGKLQVPDRKMVSRNPRILVEQWERQGRPVHEG